MITKRGIVALLKSVALMELIMIICSMGVCLLITRGSFDDRFTLGALMWVVIQPVNVLFLPIMATYFNQQTRLSIMYLIKEGFITTTINHGDDSDSWCVNKPLNVNVEFNYGSFVLSYADDPSSRTTVPEDYIAHNYPKSY